MEDDRFHSRMFRSIAVGLSLVLFLGVVGLGGCAPAPTQEPTPIPSSTPSPSPIPSPTSPPTSTPLLTPPPTPTATPVPIPDSYALLAVPADSLPLSGEWRFAVDPDGVGEESGWFGPGFDDGGWAAVTVPHTWGVMEEYSEYDGLAWYRRAFELPAGAGDAHLRLCFDAVFYEAHVWLNGAYLSVHEGGYTPFAFDVSGIARPGAENVVAVRVDNERATDRIPATLHGAWSFDWWNWGGIVRDVGLEITSRAYISRQRVVAAPTLIGVDEADTATVDTTVTVVNMSAEPLEGSLTADVLDDAAGSSVLASPVAAPVSVPPGTSVEVQLATTLASPKLWHFDHPDLYCWTTSLLGADGETLHADEVTFGVRSVELRAARFFLNGEPMRLVGLTRHADSPQYGLAETVTMMATDYDDLKTLNMLFSRPVHYPQHEFIMDYCDRNGILLIPEIPAWQLTAAQMSDEQMRELEMQQLREMVAANYNHPSVWAWSIGNEFESETVEGNEFARDMIAYVKSLDPTRPVGFASNRLGSLPQFDGTMYSDFVMMNQYFGTWAGPRGGLDEALEDIHAAWPDKPVVISEYGFEPGWNRMGWGPSTSSLDPERYYFIADETAPDAEEADEQRRLVIAEQMELFRSKPYVAAAVFWTYQDYRTPSGFIMGVRDMERNRRGSWYVLREEYAPARIESVAFSAPSGGSRTATVALRTRGPLEEDMPAYVLREYSLHWAVTAPDGAEVFSEGDLALPTLEPGSAWSGEIAWEVPEAEYVLTVEIVRPTGFAVIEHSYDSQGEPLPSGPGE